MSNNHTIVEEQISRIKKMFPIGSKIVVAMSGGVDSSVTAALIKRAGFETIGVTLKLKPANICTGKDALDAQTIAKAENFPHHVLDCKKIFKEKIIDNFVKTYEQGATPAPCAHCNKHIKFGLLLDFCKKLNAQHLVTGHYIEKETINNEEALLRSKNKNKDQSYFLALVPKENLPMMQFPLAHLPKPIVKQIAETMGLITAKKPESQDICFITNGNYKQFLRTFYPEILKKGIVQTKKGEILGQHDGLANYTIGQRKNLNLNNGPWYVLELQADTNKVIVGKLNELTRSKFSIEELNLFVDKNYFSKPIEVQLRARSEPSLANFDIDSLTVTLEAEQNAVAPGQICAFYDGSRLLGGGVIKKQLI